MVAAFCLSRVLFILSVHKMYFVKMCQDQTSSQELINEFYFLLLQFPAQPNSEDFPCSLDSLGSMRGRLSCREKTLASIGDSASDFLKLSSIFQDFIFIFLPEYRTLISKSHSERILHHHFFGSPTLQQKEKERKERHTSLKAAFSLHSLEIVNFNPEICRR